MRFASKKYTLCWRWYTPVPLELKFSCLNPDWQRLLAKNSESREDHCQCLSNIRSHCGTSSWPFWNVWPCTAHCLRSWNSEQFRVFLWCTCHCSFLIFQDNKSFFKNSWKTPFILTSFYLTRNFGFLTPWMNSVNSRNICFLFCRIENKYQDYFFQDYFASTKMRATLCTNFHATSTIWPRRKKTKKCFKVSQCIHFYRKKRGEMSCYLFRFSYESSKNKKNPLFCPWERRRKHSYKWDYQSGRRSKNCVSLSPLLRSRPRQMGACAAAKKVKKSMCGTYSSSYYGRASEMHDARSKLSHHPWK